MLSDHGVSGVSTRLCERPEGRRLFDILRDGDILVVRWIDRLGRNYQDVTDTVREFIRRGIRIETVINRMSFDGTTTDPMKQAVRDSLVASLQRQHITALLKSKKRFAARHWLKAIRALMKYAIEIGLRPDNPVTGVKLPNLKTDGYHSWTEAEIEQFEERHGLGTKARLALALLLYTGQRRGDVIRLGRQHMRDGFMHVRQQKTGIELAIPIHATLAAIIAETPADHLTLLTTQTGKPFSAAGFGNWFRDRCNEAGLAHCTAHGLRKAAARRLAEVGCTTHEIASITGHASLGEVQRYTKAADQKRLAPSAMEKAK